MKLSLIIVLLLATCSSNFAQDFSGTWRGEFSSDMSKIQRRFNIYINLEQAGKAIWGAYSTGRSHKVDSADCFCRVDAQMDKKSSVFIKLYKDKVINNIITYQSCDFVSYFELSYELRNGEEFLTGKWYGTYNNRMRSDGAGGSVILKKINPKTIIDVNQYFPNLQKLIQKSNKGDTSFLIQKN